MADPENQGTAAQSGLAPAEKSGGGGSGGEIGLSMAYIMSIPGILKIVEFVSFFYLQNKRAPRRIFFLVLVVFLGMLLMTEMTNFFLRFPRYDSDYTLHQGLYLRDHWETSQIYIFVAHKLLITSRQLLTNVYGREQTCPSS